MAAITYSGSEGWTAYSGTTSNNFSSYSISFSDVYPASEPPKKAKTELDLLDQRVNEMRVRL